MNAISNRIMENVLKWEKKSLNCADKIISENRNTTMNDEKDVKIKLETACEEISTLKAAEKLLFESLNEDNKYLKNLYEEKLHCINQKHKLFQMLENDNREFTSVNEEQGRTINKNLQMKGELLLLQNESLEDKEIIIIISLNEKCMEANMKEVASKDLEGHL